MIPRPLLALAATLALACADTELVPSDGGDPFEAGGSRDGGRRDGGAERDDRIPSIKARTPALKVVGRTFVDAKGGVVILRGVNVAGNSKVPPFVPFEDMSKLDALPGWGMNVIRLVLVWEAYEPVRGKYDETYLRKMTAIADAAWARGLYVIIDSHQDGFSRFTGGGCGSGFPRWAVSRDATPVEPDNGGKCALFGLNFVSDPNLHNSFRDLYANRDGVRDAYMTFLRRLAENFATHPGVIGYDPINEPFAIEETELGPFHAEAAATIRKVDPQAILFIEPVASRNTGSQTTLPRPGFPNFAYAPHFYDAPSVTWRAFAHFATTVDGGYNTMASKAEEWDVPLFVGEFGIPPGFLNSSSYIEQNYKKLNEKMASGAQWNITPGWTLEKRDGWNTEDFSITKADAKELRENGRPWPYLVRTSGTPIRIEVKEPGWFMPNRVVEMEWEHAPSKGETLIFMPAKELFGTDAVSIQPQGLGLDCVRTEDGRYIRCHSDSNGRMLLRVTKG